MSNALQVFDYNPQSITAVEKYGNMLAKCGWFGLDKFESGMVLVLTCQADGISPTQFLRTYDIVDGKPRKKAMAGLAEFRAKGGRFKWLKTGDEITAKEDDREARAEFTFEGQTITVSFTLGMARQQGLIRPKSNWEKTPGNMLRARVASNAVGMLCPEIFAGGLAEDEESTALVKTLELPPLSVTVDTAQPAPAPTKTVDIVTEVKPTNVVTMPLPAAASPPAPATTVEVQVESRLEPKADEPALAAAGLAPVQTPGELPEELVGKVQDVIGEHAPVAVAWFLKEGWLKAGQGIQNLTPARANQIVAKAANFKRTVLGVTEEVAK